MADDLKDLKFFIKFGNESVQAEKVVRSEWQVAKPDGRSVTFVLYLIDGHMMAIPYSDPACEQAAKLLGFAAEYAAWPKQKAAADAKHKADLDQKQAEQKAAQLRRARGYGTGV